jgi:hypothetical protein
MERSGDAMTSRWRWFWITLIVVIICVAIGYLHSVLFLFRGGRLRMTARHQGEHQT